MSQSHVCHYTILRCCNAIRPVAMRFTRPPSSSSSSSQSHFYQIYSPTQLPDFNPFFFTLFHRLPPLLKAIRFTHTPSCLISILSFHSLSSSRLLRRELEPLALFHPFSLPLFLSATATPCLEPNASFPPFLSFLSPSALTFFLFPLFPPCR